MVAKELKGTDRQTVRQTDRQADRQTDRQTDRHSQIKFVTTLTLLKVALRLFRE